MVSVCALLVSMRSLAILITLTDLFWPRDWNPFGPYLVSNTKTITTTLVQYKVRNYSCAARDTLQVKSWFVVSNQHAMCSSGRAHMTICQHQPTTMLSTVKAMLHGCYATDWRGIPSPWGSEETAIGVCAGDSDYAEGKLQVVFFHKRLGHYQRPCSVSPVLMKSRVMRSREVCKSSNTTPSSKGHFRPNSAPIGLKAP